MTWFIGFLVLVFSFHVSAKNIAPKCKFNDRDLAKNKFDVDFRGQHISVVGWYHGRAERDQAQVTMASSIKLAKQGDCQSGNKEIEKYLKKYVDQVKEGRRVLKEIHASYLRHPFKIIGLELSPKQYNQEFVDSEGVDHSMQFTAIFKNLCPYFSKNFEELSLAFPGPEFVFSERIKVKMLPMGSDELVAKTFKVLSKETLEFAKQDMSASDFKAYQAIGDLVKGAGKISKEKTEEILAGLEEPRKRKFKKYIAELNQMMDLASERDKDFVNKLVSQKTDTLIVVGNYHVAGIRKELKDRCR